MVINDETYLLMEFSCDVAGLGLNIFYPGGNGQHDENHDGTADNASGCTSCCALCTGKALTFEIWRLKSARTENQ